MRKIKISHYIISVLFLALIVLAVSFTMEASGKIVKRVIPPQEVWLIGKGDFFSDTLSQPYQHVYSDFQLLEVDGRHSSTVIEGYENGRKYLKTKVQNDTLYIMRTYAKTLPRQLELDGDTLVTEEPMVADTVPAIVDDDYPILAIIGAKSLKSITLKGEAKINIPIRPYGYKPDEGTVVFKPEDWEKYVLRLDQLDVHLYDWATAQLFLESGTVNLNLTNQITSPGNVFSNMTLTGKVEKINVIHPLGTCIINAANLKADTVIVHSNPDPLAFDIGSINVECKEYLEAKLLYEMDVNYKGEPHIVKSERDYGRVINRIVN